MGSARFYFSTLYVRSTRERGGGVGERERAQSPDGDFVHLASLNTRDSPRDTVYRPEAFGSTIMTVKQQCTGVKHWVVHIVRRSIRENDRRHEHDGSNNLYFHAVLGNMGVHSLAIDIKTCMLKLIEPLFFPLNFRRL